MKAQPALDSVLLLFVLGLKHAGGELVDVDIATAQSDQEVVDFFVAEELGNCLMAHRGDVESFEFPVQGLSALGRHILTGLPTEPQANF